MFILLINYSISISASPHLLKKCSKKHLRQAINEISLITYISLMTYLWYAINEILLIAYLQCTHLEWLCLMLKKVNFIN